MEDEDDGWKASIAPSLSTPTPRQKPKQKKDKNTSSKSKRDSAIQGTNDSSIVSKRSVERAGYDVKSRSHEWFRYFVKKPARRSPLINLGYFVRMKAIEAVVDKFLVAPSSRRKMVVNLGCGYDPLPFAYIADGTSAMFVDIDFPDLIQHKQNMIQQTPELVDCVAGTWKEGSDEIQSKHYSLVGCDLTNLSSLDSKLRSLAPDLNNTDILFISEVAIIYMPTRGADALIAYTAQFPHASFVILEQITPAGPMHPFAMTMNNHFNKLTTPLHSLPHYPTLRSQARRFLDAGYAEIEAADLNSFFYASMTPESRETAVNTELFDEYEESNAFLCHYFIAVARNTKADPYFGIKGGEWQYINWRKDVLLNGNMTPVQHCHKSESMGDSWTLTRLENERSVHRRFAACCPTGAGILIHGGLSNTTRLSTLQTLTTIRNLSPPVTSSTRPSPRMCHTLTSLGLAGSIVIGGREAPKAALSDAWVYDQGWKPVQNILHGGLYRHAAVQMGDGRVIVFGGRRNSRVSSEWLLYEHQKGWRELKCENLSALWGASLGWNGESGILTGGVDARGECSGMVYTWSIDSATSSLTLQPWELSPEARSLTRRFGAALVHINTNDFMLVGGAASHHLIPYSDQFVLLDTATQSVRVINVHNSAQSEPWLIGHNAVYDSNTGEIVLVGGGGVCFSFGSFWNEKILRLRQPSISTVPLHEWKLLDEVAPVKQPSNPVQRILQETRHLRRVRITSAADWHAVLQSREACILEDLDFGSCITKWTPEYLQSAVGPEKQVIIHKPDSEAMNFLSKNFKYITQPFAWFIDAVFHSTTERVYLRSISDDAKNKPANLAEDWPSLAPDFEIPSTLRGEDGIPDGKVFSTVLRVGSVGTSMWLHYDVMANILTQIVGEKEVLIFHPSDVNDLDIPPGASSSRIPNVFATSLSERGYSGTLKPGDAVYIPPLWPHATKPLSPNVGVNVFWKSFKDEVYDTGKDIYGNKDLLAYVEGRKLVERTLRGFKGLDRDTREFYLKRLATEMEEQTAN